MNIAREGDETGPAVSEFGHGHNGDRTIQSSVDLIVNSNHTLELSGDKTSENEKRDTEILDFCLNHGITIERLKELLDLEKSSNEAAKKIDWIIDQIRLLTESNLSLNLGLKLSKIERGMNNASHFRWNILDSISGQENLLAEVRNYINDNNIKLNIQSELEEIKVIIGWLWFLVFNIKASRKKLNKVFDKLREKINIPKDY